MFAVRQAKVTCVLLREASIDIRLVEQYIYSMNEGVSPQTNQHGVGPINQTQPPIDSPPPMASPSRGGKGWRNFFIVVGVIQVGSIGLWFAGILAAIMQARAGVSGSEFIPFALLPLVYMAGVAAFINVIGLPIYLVKYRPARKGMIFGVISFLLSLVLALYAGYYFYQMRVVFPAEQQRLDAELQEKFREYDETHKVVYPEITKEEAISLLNDCKLIGFYYTDQNDPEDGTGGNLATTGVMLTTMGEEPLRISIADSLIPELVPIAREAQKDCPDLQFWHDGHYEQLNDQGVWE